MIRNIVLNNVDLFLHISGFLHIQDSWALYSLNHSTWALRLDRRNMQHYLYYKHMISICKFYLKNNDNIIIHFEKNMFDHAPLFYQTLKQLFSRKIIIEKDLIQDYKYLKLTDIACKYLNAFDSIQFAPTPTYPFLSILERLTQYRDSHPQLISFLFEQEKNYTDEKIINTNFHTNFNSKYLKHIEQIVKKSFLHFKID